MKEILMLRKICKQFHHRERGFTLIELLVVVAVLGLLAAVAVPNIGKFIGKGKTEAYETELHNIQTTVLAMLTESTTGEIDVTGDVTGVNDMSTIVTTDSVPLVLSDYLVPLNVEYQVKSGCTYDFTVDGTVTQHLPH
jgi:prepilin-type N-terminal cleavage/methylation domain-containing protein